MQDVREYQRGDEVGIWAVMEASLEADRMDGIGRSDLERSLIRIEPEPSGTIVALDGERIVGYCTPRHHELIVHPAERRRGHGRNLLAAALPVAREGGLEEIVLHVPLHLPGSRSFASEVGLRYMSSLWSFELANEIPVPVPRFLPGLIVQTLAPDEDLDDFARFTNAAFAGHPTPISWTVELVRHVHSLPGCDPTLILVASAVDDPSHLVGFTRAEVGADDAGVICGDIGLIGVLPAWRRLGLGTELLRWGITTLRERGVARIDLKVEAENEQATAMYRRHGFVPNIEWPHWSRSVGA